MRVLTTLLLYKSQPHGDRYSLISPHYNYILIFTIIYQLTWQHWYVRICPITCLSVCVLSHILMHHFPTGVCKCVWCTHWYNWGSKCHVLHGSTPSSGEAYYSFLWVNPDFNGVDLTGIPILVH